MRLVRRRLTYANVMSTLAVFIALGGTSYAVATIGSAEITDGSVTGVDVRNGSLGSRDLSRHVLRDVRASTLFAVVWRDGTLVAGSGGVTSRKEAKSLSVDRYRVTFPRNIESCAVVPSSSAGIRRPAPQPGYHGRAGNLAIAGSPSGADVVVDTSYVDPTSGEEIADDLPFHLAVHC